MAIGIGDLSTMAIGDTGIIGKLWLDVTDIDAKRVWLYRRFPAHSTSRNRFLFPHTN